MNFPVIGGFKSSNAFSSSTEFVDKFPLGLVCLIINSSSLTSSLQGRLLARSGDYAAAADIFQRVLELWYGCQNLHTFEDCQNYSYYYILKGLEVKTTDEFSGAILFIHKILALLLLAGN